MCYSGWFHVPMKEVISQCLKGQDAQAVSGVKEECKELN